MKRSRFNESMVSADDAGNVFYGTRHIGRIEDTRRVFDGFNCIYKALNEGHLHYSRMGAMMAEARHWWKKKQGD